jgi:hypothetical protein
MHMLDMFLVCFRVYQDVVKVDYYKHVEILIGRNHSTLHSMQEALAALSIYKSVLLFVLP